MKILRLIYLKIVVMQKKNDNLMHQAYEKKHKGLFEKYY